MSEPAQGGDLAQLSLASMFLQRISTAVPGHITDMVQIQVLTDHVQNVIVSKEQIWDFLSGCR